MVVDRRYIKLIERLCKLWRFCKVSQAHGPTCKKPRHHPPSPYVGTVTKNQAYMSAPVTENMIAGPTDRLPRQQHVGPRGRPVDQWKPVDHLITPGPHGGSHVSKWWTPSGRNCNWVNKKTKPIDGFIVRKNILRWQIDMEYMTSWTVLEEPHYWTKTVVT